MDVNNLIFCNLPINVIELKSERFHDKFWFLKEATSDRKFLEIARNTLFDNQFEIFICIDTLIGKVGINFFQATTKITLIS